MRQKANPGLLSVRRTRGLGHRRCHFQTTSDSPAGFGPGSQEAQPLRGLGGFPRPPIPGCIGCFRASSLLSPQASDRDASPGIRSGPGRAVLRRDGAGAQAAGGIPGPTCRAAGLAACSARPAEGAVARASGPMVNRPRGRQPPPADAWTQNRPPPQPPSGNPSCLATGTPLAPHLTPEPAFPDHSPPFSVVLLSHRGPSRLPQVPAPLIWSPLAERQH